MNTSVLLAAAPYAITVLIAILTPIVTYAVNRILANLPTNERAMVTAAVRTGVSAAEQMASDNLNGPGKKQIALEMIEKQLTTWHINVPSSVINALVEEAVYLINTDQQKTSSPSTTAIPLAAMPEVDTKGQQ